jgi:hypothetical protein
MEECILLISETGQWPISLKQKKKKENLEKTTLLHCPVTYWWYQKDQINNLSTSYYLKITVFWTVVTHSLVEVY